MKFLVSKRDGEFFVLEGETIGDALENHASRDSFNADVYYGDGVVFSVIPWSEPEKYTVTRHDQPVFNTEKSTS